MCDNAGKHDIADEGWEWSRSVVHFIDDLIRNDDLKGSSIFAIGIGASCGDSTFDVLTTIEQFNDCKNTAQDLSHNAIVRKIFDILEKGGARNIRKTFLHTFVFECLPTSCRNWDNNAESDGGIWGRLQGAYSSVVTSVHQASTQDIESVAKKAKNKLLLNVRNVCTVQHAYQIIHGSVAKSRLTNDRVKHLMKMVEPFIYGSKPMNESLDQALELFKLVDYKKHTKTLFILSDGESSDIENPDDISKRFSDENVFIVSCFSIRIPILNLGDYTAK
ncbi:Hypothetical predicted protein [Mytilus galloprovincialis]|uniref:VWFA domain-containing protein n=1 Tax=Mytilus galloprovincialis TaxID=29158 RepID=A0A8B6HI94_MYTGA|nr:Hypothetical predicted protein [Mytilus galloprovincialis]